MEIIFTPALAAYSNSSARSTSHTGVYLSSMSYIIVTIHNIMGFRPSKHKEENLNEIHEILSYLIRLQEELEQIYQQGKDHTEQKKVFEKEISKLNTDIEKSRTDIEETLKLILDLEKKIDQKKLLKKK